jgi:hypothetical protein
MNNHKKAILTLLIIGALTVSVVGCGGNGDVVDNGNSTNSGSTTTSAVTNGGETTNGSSEASDPVLDLKIEIENITETKYFYIDENNDVRELRDDKLIFSDVRSIAVKNENSYNFTLFMIKNNNELWAVGKNGSGQLGDGTGVDRDEPVKILENVASVHVDDFMIYALANDRVLYAWGNGAYAPEAILDDVVKFCISSNAIKSDGSLWDFFFSERAPEKVMGNVISAVVIYTGYKNMVVLKGDNSVYYNDKKILENAEKLESVYISGRKTVGTLLFKIDNSLWGWGDNSDGQLGDGTKIYRDEPVKIADDVASATLWSYTDLDGNVWEWDSDDPTPKTAEE